MIKLQLKRVIKADLPNIKLNKKVYGTIGQIFSASILHNIKNQQQGDGKALKRNANVTIQQKIDRGHLFDGKVASLVAKERRFVQSKKGSWKWTAKDDSVLIEPTSQELAAISISLQKRGYTGWFDFNKQGVVLVREVLQDYIKKLFKKAARKR